MGTGIDEYRLFPGLDDRVVVNRRVSEAGAALVIEERNSPTGVDNNIISDCVSSVPTGMSTIHFVGDRYAIGDFLPRRAITRI